MEGRVSDGQQASKAGAGAEDAGSDQIQQTIQQSLEDKAIDRLEDALDLRPLHPVPVSARVELVNDKPKEILAGALQRSSGWHASVEVAAVLSDDPL